MPWTWWECWRLWDDEVECVDDDDDVEAKCVGKIVRDGGPGQTVRVVLFPDIRPTCLVASVLPRLQTLANSEMQKIRKIQKIQNTRHWSWLSCCFLSSKSSEMCKFWNQIIEKIQTCKTISKEIWTMKIFKYQKETQKKNHPRHYSNFPL